MTYLSCPTHYHMNNTTIATGLIFSFFAIVLQNLCEYFLARTRHVYVANNCNLHHDGRNKTLPLQDGEYSGFGFYNLLMEYFINCNKYNTPKDLFSHTRFTRLF